MIPRRIGLVPPPSHRRPVARATIPLAHSAVPTMYGRSAGRGCGRSKAVPHARRIAMIAATTSATKPGAYEPGTTVSRTGMSAWPAP